MMITLMTISTIIMTIALIIMRMISIMMIILTIFTKFEFVLQCSLQRRSVAHPTHNLSASPPAASTAPPVCFLIYISGGFTFFIQTPKISRSTSFQFGFSQFQPQFFTQPGWLGQAYNLLNNIWTRKAWRAGPSEKCKKLLPILAAISILGDSALVCL